MKIDLDTWGENYQLTLSLLLTVQIFTTLAQHLTSKLRLNMQLKILKYFSDKAILYADVMEIEVIKFEKSKATCDVVR